MLLGAIADDFTGASDLANTLAKGGMATTLFVGPQGSASDCNAGVVALKTRSIPAAEAIAQSVDAAKWLLDQGCEQILFKYCSTFDSTPYGNIGPVTEALLDFLGSDIAVICPAFPVTGRRIFMGHLFVGDRLLSESGMQDHPLTPMTDPDLRRWLRRQTRGEVGHVSIDSVRAGPARLISEFEALSKAGQRMVVADAITDDDLKIIGKTVASHKLITGGSGIALGLPQNFRDRGMLSDAMSRLSSVQGRGVALSGSCSLASQRQVREHLKSNPGLSIDPTEVMEGKITVSHAVDWVHKQSAGDPIVYSTADAKNVSNAQAIYGREKIASAIERFFGDLARTLADDGVSRIVVGGGETSGAVVEALQLRSLKIGEEIDPGVPVLIADRNGAIGLALKSGNFGTVDFFAKALRKVR
ncbi:3-oxo-tetronate kinase [Mesorhizobium sp. DCY119]|uniref:3-oxo-tetronate kinase n=1 Tax=Mesorhizobium sp. DCY119 TaxID=2108445 RepID=UPI000E76CD5F|nr:3-oxo-tetronate kinase [Mesorhizobium sp. DCY119]RJG41396.1 four-carbon acid sugar kinase family protein [Mesorhizobium sp. DCY119]